MTAFPARTMLVHITLSYRLHSQVCQNGFYFTNYGASSDDFLDEKVLALGTRFVLHILPAFQNFQNQQVQYEGIVVTTLSPTNGPMAEIGIANATGNQPDEALPSYCAAVLSCRTGFSGKTNRGRLYIGGVSENDHASSVLLPDSFTALENIGDQLGSHFGPVGPDPIFSHIIFSRKFGYSNGLWFSQGVRMITHYVARRNLGTCRHRLLGFGT